MSKPTRPLAYVRLSDLRAEDLDLGGRSSSLDDQTRRIMQWCSARGWPAPEVLVENDLTKEGKPKPASAFKRRKVRLPDGRTEFRVVRPVFRAIVDRLGSGRNDALVALDLDRAVRDPRDLEDLVDLVEQRGVLVDSVTGSLRLATDADVTMARVMVAMANKESRDKARRVSASRERRAREGKFGGGRRPFGFEPDGVTVRPAEAAVIAECCHAIVKGASLRGLARDLRDRGVPTVTGRPWSAETLKDILIRPRNVGVMEWRGQHFPAPWEPLVEPAVFERVAAILTDPERRTGPGRPPRWLGSGIYRCGVCGGPVTVIVAGRHPRYTCRGNSHLSRHALRTDEVVAAFVIEYLAEHGAGLLVPDRPEVDVAALRTERKAIVANLEAIGADVVLGRLTRAAGHKATEVGRARIAEIDSQLSSATVDPLGPWVNAVDPAAMWGEATLEERRMLVRRLLKVTILPVGPGGRFRPESVKVEPSTLLS